MLVESEFETFWPFGLKLRFPYFFFHIIQLYVFHLLPLRFLILGRVDDVGGIRLRDSRRFGLLGSNSNFVAFSANPFLFERLDSAPLLPFSG